MAPADAMPPGPFLVDGWGIAAWRFIDHLPGLTPGPAETLAALDELRVVLRDYPGELPVFGPVAGDLDLAFGFAFEAGILDAMAIDALRRRRDTLLARLCALDPALEPQHGDAFPRNTVVDVAGRVTWIDLEDACLASPSWDLAVLARHTRDASVRAAAEARVGREVLDSAIALRDLQGDVWNALHDARVARGW